MIEAITIEGVASYTGQPVELRDFGQFNFIYGPNGSGKTTISRLIANIAEHPQCSLSWKNGRQLETLVYNRDFVSKVFVQTSELPGIFSLGEETNELLARIDSAKSKISKLEEQRGIWKAELEGEDGNGGKRGDLVIAKDALTDACWEKRASLGQSCDDAFKGFRHSKAKFVQAVLSRKIAQDTTKRTKQYLQVRAETIFGDPPAAVAQLDKLDCSKLSNIGQPSILSKPIVGANDINIGAFIERLGNSDWVKSGQELLVNAHDTCPFCQQALPESLEKDLNDYFDETYLNDIAVIDSIQKEYCTAARDVLNAIDQVLTDPPPQLDAVKVKEKRDALSAHITTNKARIDRKKKEPSSIVALEGTESLTFEIEGLIQCAIDDITAHNLDVSNHAEEKKALTNECWKYLIEDELRSELSTYSSKKTGIDKAIEGLEDKLEANQLELNEVRTSLAELQKQTTSIKPTIVAINGVLQSFGFDGFQIAEAETPHCYKLVRADGSDAKETLSEGERTFVTFLYFYNLIMGSLDQAGAMTDRVVVFDDPVSSLDSDVLFIVTTLIKRVQQYVLNSQNRVKQLFVLTHNVYFHKEVTYDPRGCGIGASHKRYWTVRKSNGCSSVTPHERNPIRTGYDLLWAELRAPSGSTVATQNAMRRILEHYYKMLGGREPLDICREFEGADQLICRSLISWINDGSHHASDDLYMVVDQETIDSYQRVFKLIFEKTNHLGHYEMMMRTLPSVQPEEASVISSEAEESRIENNDV